MSFDTSYLLVLLVGLLGIAVILRVVMHLRRRPGVRRRPGDSGSSAGATLHDIEQAMSELDGLARQIHARVDQQVNRLERLMREADGRIDRLERLVRGVEGRPTLDVTVTDTLVSRLSPTTPTSSDNNERVAQRPVADSPAEIYRLADAGLSPIQIATQTGRSTGEVELILSLRRTKEQKAQSVSQ